MKYGPLTKQISNSGCNQGDTNSFGLLHVASGVPLRCSQFQVNPVVKYISEQLNIPTDSRSLTTTNTSNGNWIIRCSVLWIAVWNCPHTYLFVSSLNYKFNICFYGHRLIVIFSRWYESILRMNIHIIRLCNSTIAIFLKKAKTSCKIIVITPIWHTQAQHIDI
jgi:hypothetical protein